MFDVSERRRGITIGKQPGRREMSEWSLTSDSSGEEAGDEVVGCTVVGGVSSSSTSDTEISWRCVEEFYRSYSHLLVRVGGQQLLAAFH